MTMLLSRRGCNARPLVAVPHPQIVGTTAGGRSSAGSASITPPPGAAVWYAFVIGGGGLTPPSNWSLIADYGDGRAIYMATTSPGSSWSTTTVFSLTMIGLDTNVLPGVFYGVNGALVAPATITARPALVVRILLSATDGAPTVGYPAAAPASRNSNVTLFGGSNYGVTAVAAESYPTGGDVPAATWTTGATMHPDIPAMTAVFMDPLPAFTPVSPGSGLVWSDEFNGSAGALPYTDWSPEYWPALHRNSEVMAYTPRTDNLVLTGTELKIRGLRETFNADGIAAAWTSGRIMTRTAYRYGHYEARIKVPAGQGLWPAFWLLGAQGWPGHGEIDIMEAVNSMVTVQGTATGAKNDGSPWSLFGTTGGSFSSDYHVYELDWSSTQLVFGIDGTPFYTLNKASVTSPNVWSFDYPMNIILNLALGGSWPGSPDGTTPNVNEMLVDWVRVYDAEVYPDYIGVG